MKPYAYEIDWEVPYFMTKEESLASKVESFGGKVTELYDGTQVYELLDKIFELEQLCDETYVAKGADAYNYATDLMENFQEERAKENKDPGTQGSLCDGISWLFDYINQLEDKLETINVISSLCLNSKTEERMQQTLERIKLISDENYEPR